MGGTIAEAVCELQGTSHRQHGAGGHRLGGGGDVEWVNATLFKSTHTHTHTHREDYEGSISLDHTTS